MSRKAARKQMVREAEDRARQAAEREEYREAEVGAPCPRCAAIWEAFRRDLDRGCGMAAFAEGACWLCQNTYRVVPQ